MHPVCRYRATYVGSTDELIDLGGVKAVHISPKAGVTIAGKPGKTAAARDTRNVMYYLHGGAYIAGDPRVQYQVRRIAVLSTTWCPVGVVCPIMCSCCPVCG